jgi:hypothetical protein
MGNTPLTRNHLQKIDVAKHNFGKVKELLEKYNNNNYDWDRCHRAFKNSKNESFRYDEISNYVDMIGPTITAITESYNYGMKSLDRILTKKNIEEKEECYLNKLFDKINYILGWFEVLQKFIDENAPIIIEEGQCTSSEANAPIETNNEGQ